MEFLIKEKCKFCDNKFSGMQDVFFIYEYSRCIECYQVRVGRKKATEEYNKVKILFEDGQIPEDFYELINIIIRNV
jgi:hypothetical protein